MKKYALPLASLCMGIFFVLLVAALTPKNGAAAPSTQGKDLPNKAPTEIPTAPIPVPSGVPSIVPIQCETLPFSDVSTSDWFYYGVRYLWCERAATGYSTNPPCNTGTPCFKPGSPLTRGQAAKIIAGLFLISFSAEGEFSDVPPGSPFYSAVGKMRSGRDIRISRWHFQAQREREQRPVRKNVLTDHKLLVAQPMAPNRSRTEPLSGRREEQSLLHLRRNNRLTQRDGRLPLRWRRRALRHRQ